MTWARACLAIGAVALTFGVLSTGPAAVSSPVAAPPSKVVVPPSAPAPTAATADSVAPVVTPSPRESTSDWGEATAAVAVAAPSPAAESAPAAPATEPVATPDSPAAVTTPQPQGPLEIYVAGPGEQYEIDACIGAIDYYDMGLHFAEHNYCGGDRYHQLDVGSTVQLTGYVSGLYEVVLIYDSWALTSEYDFGQVHLQTSLGGGKVRLWQMQPVG